MIYYNLKCGLASKKCLNRLHLAFENKASSKSCVYNWFAVFQRRRTSLENEFREGRPSTSVVTSNVDAVRDMIKVDRRVTYNEIKASLVIGMKAINTILHEYLKVRKLFCRWIPHNLTSIEKESHMKWCQNVIKKFNRSSNLTYNIVSADET